MRRQECIFLIQREARKSMVGKIILIYYDNESSTILSFSYLLPKRHQSQTKYMKRSKIFEQNQSVTGNFSIYFCITFDRCYQRFFSGKQKGYKALCPANVEIFERSLIFHMRSRSDNVETYIYYILKQFYKIELIFFNKIGIFII